jgi:hypothetical protein
MKLGSSGFNALFKPVAQICQRNDKNPFNSVGELEYSVFAIWGRLLSQAVSNGSEKCGSEDVERQARYLWQCFRKLNQPGIFSGLLRIVATRLRAGWSATWISARTRGFCLFWKMETDHGGTPSLLFSGYSSSFPEIRRTGNEGNYSRPSSVEVKNEWSNTCTPACSHGLDRETFTRLTRRFECEEGLDVEILYV